MTTQSKLSEVVKQNAPCIIKNYFGCLEPYKKRTTAEYFANSIDHLFDDVSNLEYDWSRRECFVYLNSLIAEGPKVFDGFIRRERAMKQDKFWIDEYKAAKKRWEGSGICSN